MSGYGWAAVAIWVACAPILYWYCRREKAAQRAAQRAAQADRPVHPSQRNHTTAPAAPAQPTTQPAQPHRPQVVVHFLTAAELVALMDDPAMAATLADIDALPEVQTP